MNPFKALRLLLFLTLSCLTFRINGYSYDARFAWHATFAYDVQNKIAFAYDDSDESAAGCYDAGSVLTTGKKDDGTPGGCVSLAQFAGFLAAETTATGAENAINGVRLNQQLSAQSAFNASGGLSQEAITGAREIIPSAELGNPAIPSGFSKFSTGTFDSPSGPFQVHFYQNPTTGEIWNGLDYKSVFNNPIGH